MRKRPGQLVHDAVKESEPSGPSEVAAQLDYRAEFIAIFALALAVFLAFSPAFQHHFLNIDDPHYVADNGNVLGGLDGPGIAWAFTTFHASNWHPLTWLSLQMDATLFGSASSGYHATSIFLHALGSVLLFLALRALTGTTWQSALAAGFFALHPLRVESVAWVSERKDVLSGVFWMLTLLAYAYYVRQASVARYALVVLCFSAGLLAKPMLVTLPCVLLLLDYWPLRRHEAYLATGQHGKQKVSALGVWARLVLEKVPLFALSLVSCVITLKAQQAAAASLDALPFGSRLANALMAYIGYLSMTFWPADLAPMYLLPNDGYPVWQPIAAAVLLLALTALCVVGARHGRGYLLVGWLWFLGTMVPVIGLIQVGRQAMADRYTYLPSIGLALMVVWGVADLAVAPRARLAAVGAAAGLLVVTMVLTWGQTHLWNNDVTLWEHTLEVTGPDNAYAHGALGLVLWKQGKSAEAAQHFDEALRVRYEDPEIYTTLGLLSLAQNEMDKADRYLHQAVRLAPDNARAQNNLGTGLYEQGRLDEAAAHFRLALKLRPRDDKLYFNLGLVLKEQGDWKKAAQSFQRAVELSPNSAHYQSALGLALNRLGQGELASAAYQHASSLNPAWMQDYHRGAWIKATHPDARFRKGIRAIEFAEQVCDATQRSNAGPLDALAAAYAETGRFDDAVATSRQALAAAEASGAKELVAPMRERLALYERRQPYRMSANEQAAVAQPR